MNPPSAPICLTSASLCISPLASCSSWKHIQTSCSRVGPLFPYHCEGVTITGNISACYLTQSCAAGGSVLQEPFGNIWRRLRLSLPLARVSPPKPAPATLNCSAPNADRTETEKL